MWLDGHSDYGNSLETFHNRYGRQLTSRTTVIITGDARNNYRPPRDRVLGDIAEAARAVIWLNPEPPRAWEYTRSTQMILQALGPRMFPLTLDGLARGIEALKK